MQNFISLTQVINAKIDIVEGNFRAHPGKTPLIDTFGSELQYLAIIEPKFKAKYTEFMESAKNVFWEKNVLQLKIHPDITYEH